MNNRKSTFLTSGRMIEEVMGTSRVAKIGIIL